MLPGATRMYLLRPINCKLRVAARPGSVVPEEGASGRRTMGLFTDPEDNVTGSVNSDTVVAMSCC